jgi:hypothetical protein
MSRRQKLVKVLLKYLGTKPSKRQISVIAVLIMVSFGLGMTYQKVNQSQQTPLDCKADKQDREAKNPVVEPYYNETIGACMVPEIYLDNQTEPGGNTTNVTN